MRLNISEASVLNNVLDALTHWGFHAFRVNTGKIKSERGHWITLAPEGTADVCGIVPGSGRFLAIEVKRKGGKPTQEQREFLAAVQTAGGVAVAIDDVRKLDPILVELRRNPHAQFHTDGTPQC